LPIPRWPASSGVRQCGWTPLANVQTVPMLKNLASLHSNFQKHSYYRKHSNFQYQHRLTLIQAHADWAQGWLNEGWDGYLFSFMFNQLPGSRHAMVQQMHQELLRWYGRLATRTVRKPRSPVWIPFLPKGIFVPDLPVPKRSKQNIRDVSTNDGLHMHGIVVANRWREFPRRWMFISRQTWVPISPKSCVTSMCDGLPIQLNTSPNTL
jgi:hypothetical protein